MLIPKTRLVREFNSSIDDGVFIKEIAEHAKSLLTVGRISDSNLGFGFNVTMGKPQTVRGLLFPETSLDTVSNTEGLNKVKELIE